MNKEKIGLIAGFLIMFALVTFPLIFNFTGFIPGFSSTDEPFYALWDSWRIKYSLQHNIPPVHTDFIAYPYGRDLYSQGNISHLLMIIFYALSILTTHVLTYNIQILVNLFLSFLFVYMLVLILTQRRTNAVFSGIMYAFCPYQLTRGWQHLGLTYNEWLPLCLFALILLKERFTKKRVILLLISAILLFSFDYTIAYMGFIAVAAFLIYTFFFGWRVKLLRNRCLCADDFRYIKKIGVIFTAASIILLPQILPIVTRILSPASSAPASAHNPYHRPFDDLFSQSARPLSYFLPAASHPLLGRYTEGIVGSSWYGISFTEHALYLGWIPLIFAFIAFKRWKIGPKALTAAHESPMKGNERFYPGFFLLLAVVAWFFSQPPWWKICLVKMYMPSFFMYKILPMYRAYCRFGIVLMLAVAVLAGFGLKFFLERFRSLAVRRIVSACACGLVLFEFWNWPPYKVIDISRAPAVYYWLREQPKEVVIAEYPMDADSPNEMYKFYQITHEKRMINGSLPGTPANDNARKLRRLSEEDTTAQLRPLGVKYVLVHRQGYFETGLTEDEEELNAIPRNPSLRLIQSFPAEECSPAGSMCTKAAGVIDLYEIIGKKRD